MKNLKLFDKIYEKLFNDYHFKVVYPKEFDINNIFLDMDRDNIEEKKVDGVGTFCLIKETDIPYLLYVPQEVEKTDRLIMEVNNCESDDKKKFLLQGVDTIKKNFSFINHPVPILVPLIPTEKGKPYYQQISKDGFEEHIDLKVDKIIDHALDKIEEISGVRMDDKIFLNGYSSSAVFAQRFCLLHPERVDTAVIGGASGSIPSLDKSIDYPLGIRDISNFNMDAYKNIKFKYYVGEYELIDLSNNRRDVIDGKIVTVSKPMHDMTYFQRSIDPIVGKAYRDKYGEEYFDRTNNVVRTYKENGIDINSTVIRGRTHSRMEIDGKLYKGTTEGIGEIIDSAYRKSILGLRREESLKR